MRDHVTCSFGKGQTHKPGRPNQTHSNLIHVDQMKLRPIRRHLPSRGSCFVSSTLMPHGLRLDLSSLRAACKRFHWRDALHLLDGHWAVARTSSLGRYDRNMKDMKKGKQMRYTLEILVGTSWGNMTADTCPVYWNYFKQSRAGALKLGLSEPLINHEPL